MHEVTAELDVGPILDQAVVPVLPGDTAETLRRRITEDAEWDLITSTVKAHCAGTLRLADGRAVWDAPAAEPPQPQVPAGEQTDATDEKTEA